MTPHFRCGAAVSPLQLMASLGRCALMDFGLAGLFERFESSFGKRLTWWLTVLIGLAISGTCLKLIWAVISPMYSFISGLLIADDGNREVLDALAVVGLILIGMMIAAHLVNGIELRKASVKAKETAQKLDEQLTEVEEISRHTNERADRAIKALKQIDDLIDRLYEANNLTRTQRSVDLSPPKPEEETPPKTSPD